MIYLIFNILLIILVIVILFKPYIINEGFVDLKPESTGFSISTEPVKIDIINTQKQTQQIEPSEEIFPTPYSAPFVQPSPTQIQPEPQPEPQPEQPQVSVKDISNCKITLNNKIKEINALKAQQASDKQKMITQQHIDDQNLALQNAITVQQYKAKTTTTANEYKGNQTKLNDLKTQNTNCQSRIASFNFNLDQAQNCCSSETQRVLQLKQNIYDKCVVPQSDLNSKLNSLNSLISTTQDQINQVKSSNDDLQNKMKNC